MILEKRQRSPLRPEEHSIYAAAHCSFLKFNLYSNRMSAKTLYLVLS
ncbi:hypothetical protein FHS14_003824 [Paenibacillus baekrokdamisoli]|nr:hypothetical protein [Paenibacillus baekrokdamisoli]